MALILISYKDAKAKGLKRYFTGKRCKNGHIAERFVVNCACRQCTIDRTDKWLAYRDNADLKNTITREWLKKYPDYQRQWAKDHPDSVRMTKRDWYLTNASREIARVTQWGNDNKERRRANIRNRTAMRKGAPGSHTDAEIIAMLEAQNWQCVYCPASLRQHRHIDHKIALINGGSNDIGNLQGTCPVCNMRKGAKDHDKFVEELAAEAERACLSR